jgi:hypothetical protein
MSYISALDMDAVTLYRSAAAKLRVRMQDTKYLRKIVLMAV